MENNNYAMGDWEASGGDVADKRRRRAAKRGRLPWS